MGLLTAAREVEFSYLKEQLQLSDSDLSKQLKVLTDAGYATSRRTGKGKTRASWFSCTADGRNALESHAAALQALLRPPVRSAGAVTTMSQRRSTDVA